MDNSIRRYVQHPSLNRESRRLTKEIQVTLTLYLVGAVPGLRSIYIVTAQIIASIAAAGVASATFPGPMNVDLKLGGGTSIAQGCFIEMFTTLLLVFTVIMLAAVKHKATYIAPIGIGMALFVGHLCSKSKPKSKPRLPIYPTNVPSL